MKAKDVVAVIKTQHWHELADFLGVPLLRVKETLTLNLTLLDSMGYMLVRTGANTDATAPLADGAPPPPLPSLPVDKLALFAAVEDVLAEMTERRLRGEQISDQAEVRAIVQAALNTLE